VPRGKKKHKKGKLVWRNKSASHGRKPNMGKRPHFMTWAEVRAVQKRNATNVVHPSHREGAEAAAAPAPAAEAAAE
jgi:hypothetical protein